MGGPTLVVLVAVLQTGGLPSGGYQLAVVVTDVLGALLGLVIAAIAYRGYRRNRSRPMFFLSLGFVLALGVPMLGLFVYLLTPLPESVVALSSQAAELLGLAIIVYALRVDP